MVDQYPLPTALLVVDVQKHLTQSEDPQQPSCWNLDQTLTNMEALIAEARAIGADVIYVQHNSLTDPYLQRGQPGFDFEPRIAPADSDTIIGKRVCNVFAETDIKNQLIARGVKHYVVCGIQSDYCVDMAAKGGLSAGFLVTLASDAHTTWDNGVLTAEQIIAHHNVNVADMSGPNARVLVKPTADIGFAPSRVDTPSPRISDRALESTQ
jgi:nicotinamidase-related amidase